MGLPSKGPLADPTLELLEAAGMKVVKPSLRQYVAEIPSLPGLTVLFQRPGDLVTSVREGSLDFCITGLDVYAEQNTAEGPAILIQPGLGYGQCSLNIIVPEALSEVNRMRDIPTLQAALGRPLHVATKFPNLTRIFLEQHGIRDFELIFAEGTLEIAPTIGSADLISDLVSTGNTLRDNRLKRLEDGLILSAQACLVASRNNLKSKPESLRIARQLLEYIVAYQRAVECVSVFVNMRGDSPRAIADRMFSQPLLSGLQGPTISQVLTRNDENWFAAHLVVRKADLQQAIMELREIGGSGVVVSPVTYIFEEEPKEYRRMIQMLEEEG